MRRRSRSRGSVSPPTQRPTVLTETPSCRAAASWVSPSRRSAVDIQSANVAGRGVVGHRGRGGGGRADRPGAGRRGPRCDRDVPVRQLRWRLVGVQHVDLDMLREDAERDLDRTGRPGRVQQGAEHGLADLPVALLGQRRFRQAAPDEVADLRDPGWPGREGLRQNHHGDDLDRPIRMPVAQLRHSYISLTNCRPQLSQPEHSVRVNTTQRANGTAALAHCAR